MSSIRVITKTNCSKTSPQGKGEITYHASHSETKKKLHMRVTKDTGGGFFLQ